MLERRGKSGTTDTGVRTRCTDHAHTPQAEQDWMSTFQVRWTEHLGRERQGDWTKTAA